VSWSDRQIRGKLENDPVRRADLRCGQDVELDEGEIYDWLITHTDGRWEGAAMNEFLARAIGRGGLPLG
jgi:hypothetical protein